MLSHRSDSQSDHINDKLSRLRDHATNNGSIPRVTKFKKSRRLRLSAKAWTPQNHQSSIHNDSRQWCLSRATARMKSKQLSKEDQNERLMMTSKAQQSSLQRRPNIISRFTSTVSSNNSGKTVQEEQTTSVPNGTWARIVTRQK